MLIKGHPWWEARQSWHVDHPLWRRPLLFFGGDGKKAERHGACFKKDKDPGAWWHGDLIEMTVNVGDAGGVVAHGRSGAAALKQARQRGRWLAEEGPVVKDSLIIGDQHKAGRQAGDAHIDLFVSF